jgi:hypothetical protein
MKALTHLYTRGVLWLLSVVAAEAVAAIHAVGREDGMTALRDFMRRDLTAMHAASVADRLRSYQQGFRDAMRVYGADEPQDDAPSERVM